MKKDLKVEVRMLKAENELLVEIIESLFKKWKQKHPKDFELSKDSTLVKYSGGKRC